MYQYSDYYFVLLQIENIHREHYLYSWQPDPLNCCSMCITELCLILAEHCKSKKKVLSKMMGGFFTLHMMRGIKIHTMWHTVNTHGLTLSFYLPTVMLYNVFDIYYNLNLYWVIRWRSWLRHCATSQKVVGSIPNGVIGIFY